MTREQFKGLFLLWVFVVILELVWLYVVTTDIVITGRVIFIITLIASTLAIGSLGIYLVGKNLTKLED